MIRAVTVAGAGTFDGATAMIHRGSVVVTRHVVTNDVTARDSRD